MGEIKSLVDKEAIEKIKELADGKICLFCTFANGKIVTRPMSTGAIDDDGSIYFLSLKQSAKNEQLKKDDEVYLMYMETGKEHYLSLSGTADIFYDKEKIEELWSPFASAWVEGGKDDPNLTVIKISPTEGQYWDTKNGRLVSMIKIAVAAISGKTGDDGGVEGKLKF